MLLLRYTSILISPRRTGFYETPSPADSWMAQGSKHEQAEKVPI